MGRLSDYGDGEQLAPQANQESGKDTASSKNIPSRPDLSKDGDVVPPTSV